MDSIEDFVDNSTMRASSEHDRNNRVAVYDEAIAIQPHAYLYYNRGNAKLDLKRYEEAIFDYDQALALEATTPMPTTTGDLPRPNSNAMKRRSPTTMKPSAFNQPRPRAITTRPASLL